MKMGSSIFLLCYLLCAPFVFAGNDVSFKREEKHSSSLSQKESEMRIADSPAVMIDPVFTQVKKVLATNGAEYDIFGISVSISGDTVVVGAYGDDDKGDESGSGYVYKEYVPNYELKAMPWIPLLLLDD